VVSDGNATGKDTGIQFDPKLVGTSLRRSLEMKSIERTVLEHYRASGYSLARIDSIVVDGNSETAAVFVDPGHVGVQVHRVGGQVRAVALDVTNEQAAARAVAIATEAFGGLDVLANNAGYGNVSSIEDTSLDEFRAQIETNLFGVINVT